MPNLVQLRSTPPIRALVLGKNTKSKATRQNNQKQPNRERKLDSQQQKSLETPSRHSRNSRVHGSARTRSTHGYDRSSAYIRTRYVLCRLLRCCRKFCRYILHTHDHDARDQQQQGQAGCVHKQAHSWPGGCNGVCRTGSASPLINEKRKAVRASQFTLIMVGEFSFGCDKSLCT